MFNVLVCNRLLPCSSGSVWFKENGECALWIRTDRNFLITTLLTFGQLTNGGRPNTDAPPWTEIQMIATWFQQSSGGFFLQSEHLNCEDVQYSDMKHQTLLSYLASWRPCRWERFSTQTTCIQSAPERSLSICVCLASVCAAALLAEHQSVTETFTKTVHPPSPGLLGLSGQRAVLLLPPPSLLPPSKGETGSPPGEKGRGLDSVLVALKWDVAAKPCRETRQWRRLPRRTETRTALLTRLWSSTDPVTAPAGSPAPPPWTSPACGRRPLEVFCSLKLMKSIPLLVKIPQSVVFKPFSDWWSRFLHLIPALCFLDPIAADIKILFRLFSPL